MRQHRTARLLKGHVTHGTVTATIAASLLLMQGVSAQGAPPPPARERPPVEAEALPNRAAPPGYEPDLLRLSEVMGALSFLRKLCGASDAPQWHGRMSALIDSEARDAQTRARLAGAFNQGFNGFAITYRTCTPAAQMAVTRYLEEGERLSRLIASRFGG
ncbi:TIGR02301 family protein [Pseudochelatococcus sp. G4_1912]|uniref:TIGR02301 family protein n=1 Tax=Pseudochelatococcus sp. G4_1912 TaxID=3114288 RepID=UPI0039C6E769